MIEKLKKFCFYKIRKVLSYLICLSAILINSNANSEDKENILSYDMERYFERFYYSIKMNQDLLTEKVANGYSAYQNINSTKRLVFINEFEEHDYKENRKKEILSLASQVEPFGKIKASLGSYDFKNSEFPIYYSFNGYSENIKIETPCLEFGAGRGMPCIKKYINDGMPNSIGLSIDKRYLPEKYKIPEAKARELISKVNERDISFEVSVYDVNITAKEVNGYKTDKHSYLYLIGRHDKDWDIVVTPRYFIFNDLPELNKIE